MRIPLSVLTSYCCLAMGCATLRASLPPTPSMQELLTPIMTHEDGGLSALEALSPTPITQPYPLNPAHRRNSAFITSDGYQVGPIEFLGPDKIPFNVLGKISPDHCYPVDQVPNFHAAKRYIGLYDKVNGFVAYDLIRDKARVVLNVKEQSQPYCLIGFSVVKRGGRTAPSDS